MLVDGKNMKKINYYTKNCLILFRIIAIIAVLVLAMSVIRYTFTYGTKLFLQFEVILDIINIILLSVVIIKPYKLGLFAIVASFYSVSSLVMSPANHIGILMYFLVNVILCVRGYFKKNTKQKNIFSVSILTILIFSNIRFGYLIFINSLVNKIGYILTLFLCCFFYHGYLTNLFDAETQEKKLDLKKYANLSRRDAEWLAAIIKKTKYEAIAINSDVSLGTLKNRLKFIFKTLEVGDKRGFLNRYSGYEIMFGSDCYLSKFDSMNN